MQNKKTICMLTRIFMSLSVWEKILRHNIIYPGWLRWPTDGGGRNGQDELPIPGNQKKSLYATDKPRGRKGQEELCK